MKTIFQTICLLLTLLTINLSVARSQTIDEAKTDQRTENGSQSLPQILPGTSILIRIDLGRIELPDVIAKAIASGDSKTDADVSQQIVGLQSKLNALKELIGDEPMYVLVDMPLSPDHPSVRLAFPNGDEAIQKKITEYLAHFEIRTAPSQNGWLLASLSLYWPFDSTVQGRYFYSEVDETVELPLASAGSIESFEEGLKVVANQPLQIVVVPPDYLWRTYEELLTELPVQWGGGPVNRLTDGIRWMAIGIDPKTLVGSATVQSASPAAANQFAPFAPELFSKILGQLPKPVLEMIASFPAMIASGVESQVIGDQIRYTISPSTDSAPMAGEFLGLVERLFRSQMDREVKPKLRELALAILNHESASSCFPPAAKFRDANGNCGLSWRVHILPYMNENELYDQFNLDEPWDSPHNKPLIAKMPAAFGVEPFHLKPTSYVISAGHTTFVAPVGQETIFGGTEVVTLGKVTDGFHNTIMIVEVKPEFAVPWTAPQDYAFDPENPATGLKIGQSGKFTVVFADTSVQEISSDLPAQSMLHLFQMNDGNVVTIK